MKYLIIAAVLALADCASIPPPREVPPRELAELSPLECSTIGFTLGLLVIGVVWNFMPARAP